jgi:hypothetical protein
MTQFEPDQSVVRRLAEAWLKRPLTPTEEIELNAFMRTVADTPPAQAAAVNSSDPAAHARAQASQALTEGQARTGAAIRDILQKISGTTAQALQAQEREEQAILKVVEAAKTLSDLRPSALSVAASGVATGERMVMSQIADRLANLVKTEVEQSFRQSFGRLQQQLESAIGEFQEAKQQLQQASTATAAPSAPPATPPAPPATPPAPAAPAPAPQSGTSPS